MDIIFLAEDGRQRLQFSSPRLVATLSLLLLAASAVFWAGSKFGIDSVRVRPTGTFSLWDRDLSLQEAHVAAAVERAENGVNVLVQRLGQLQARADRMDAFGAWLLKEANVPGNELNFSRVPAIDRTVHSTVFPDGLTDFLTELRELETRLADREPKLEALSDVLRNRDLRKHSRPAGRPVEHGWMSSRYGYRFDPKTGKRVFHWGADFAGPRGTRVLVTGDGVVTGAAYKAGYGNTVKVSHPRGYLTRYAHNAKNLVSVGDIVRKGTPVALMGATGRTTGTHLHYEVHRNGSPVDPHKLISESH